ncbi:MAG: histidinol-phosphate transaminase [Thermoleophilia bacterium]|nr:histidinol-phosphate transaminase [Thermoleophilia bacterium]
MKFIPQIKNLTPYVAGTPIEVVAREYGLDRVVKLASNESPLPPFPEVLDVITSKFDSLNRYPDAEARDLRAALAGRYTVEPDQVILGNGSCELLIWLSLIFLEPGAEAVFSDPTFLVYDEVTLARGATPVKVPLDGFTNDLNSMAAAVNDRTRIVFLTNPHNPTGTYLPATEIAAFAAGLPADCALVLDEAYNEYVEEPDAQGGLALFRANPNVILLRTFSKIYGLCGLRVGYGLCSPQVKEAIDKVRQPFNINTLAQAAALKALSLEDRLEERRALNREGRVQLYSGLGELGIGYIETQSNFMLVEIDQLSVPAANAPVELLRRGVIVRDGAALGCPGYMRVSIGTAGENDFLLEKLAELKN